MEQLKELIPTPSKLNGVTENEGVDQNSDPVHRKTEDYDPTSDCLTSEMKDLPVQTDQALPPLTERKNGRIYFVVWRKVDVRFCMTNVN